MSAVSDSIERFIIELLSESNDIELRRNQLAQYFGCSPSQINYVLTTRFSPEKGYLITSKRGGGGHITIARIQTDKQELLYSLISGGIGDSLDKGRAKSIIQRLYNEKIVSLREAHLLWAAMEDSALLPHAACDKQRAVTLKRMLTTLLKEE